jgi:GNAT superfamily N-acetyltransferase
MGLHVDIKGIEAYETFLMRRNILRPGMELEDVEFPGDDHPDTLHAGAFVGRALVGVASVYRVPPPWDHEDEEAWQVRGMATLEELRGRGIGRWLVALCMQHAYERAGHMIWCNARLSAVRFYEKLGFETRGDEFDIPDVGPHVVMWRTLES